MKFKIYNAIRSQFPHSANAIIAMLQSEWETYTDEDKWSLFALMLPNEFKNILGETHAGN